MLKALFAVAVFGLVGVSTFASDKGVSQVAPRCTQSSQEAVLPVFTVPGPQCVIDSQCPGGKCYHGICG